MKFSTKLFHFKLKYIGDKVFEKDGTKIIPCESCDKPFRSFMHYGEMGYVYDSKCERCLAK